MVLGLICGGKGAGDGVSEKSEDEAARMFGCVELKLRCFDGAIPVVTSFRDLASDLACC
jgi:hypothetical protein